MIGIDTNVLLRLLLDDDAAQVPRARREAARAEAAGDALLVNDVVLVETVWTLQSRYGADKRELLVLLHGLLDHAQLTFESRSALDEAVAGFENTNADFPDCLILAKNAAAGCAHTATFDRTLRSFEHAKLI